MAAGPPGTSLGVVTTWSKLSCAALAAFLLASCGGDDESAAEQWAGDVCTAGLTWRQSIDAAAESVRSAPSVDGLEAAVENVKSATRAFADDLEGLGAPETSAGDEAETLVEALAESLRTSVSAVEQEVAGVESAAGAVDAATAIATSLASTREQVQETVDELGELDARGELGEAFDDAGSCDDLRAER